MFYLKNFLLGSIFFALSTTIFAQTGIVKGVVLSEDSEKIYDANVYLNELKWAISDSNGSFEIEAVPTGTYTLTISKIGYRSYQKTLSINSGDIVELEVILSPEIYQGSTAVVTATRSSQDIESVPISVDVISEDEIQNSAANTLKDILLEQAGITLSPGEDNAIQVQGFESDYTLILIDGQPLIGRVRGAFDVSRINTSNIKQVEVVKGPSSALWGSDALAGVINIITKKPTQDFSGSAFTEIGSRAGYNGGASFSFNKNKLSGRAGFSVDGSDGFDLSDEEFGNNQNPYDNHTFNSSVGYSFSELTSISVSARYFKTNFSGQTLASILGQNIAVDEDGWQEDFSMQVQLNTSPFNRFDTKAILYSTRYEDFSETIFDDPNEDDIVNSNLQGLDRVELQNNYVWLNNHISTFGFGVTKEFVDAERYQGKRNQEGVFLFGQHQFLFGEKFNLTTGARLDNHSSYNSYVSPKVSAKYDLTDNLSFRASWGKGFKAPDLRTLYLNFDNAGSSYRVFGVENIGAELEQLESSNLISQYFRNPSALNSLEPEFSTAVNIGLSYKLFTDRIKGKVNVFRNNAQNLIEAIEVARLNDNSGIYGYVNINKARTQGVEAEQSFLMNESLSIYIGYQYLEAVELTSDTLTVIENGNVVRKEVESDVPLAKRPKHSGSVRLLYEEPLFGTEVSIRGILKSEYFYNDDNVNKKADANEFADAYAIWNINITKQFDRGIRAQVGVNNLFNHTDNVFLRFQPGTTFFTKITYEF
ncbi:MAG: TonB-dependent receptor [Balneolaceae bacterium]